MTFHIDHKAYTVDIGEDKEKLIYNGITKFINLDDNISVSELLSAYIKKTYELVQLENSLEELSLKIDEVQKL